MFGFKSLTIRPQSSHLDPDYAQTLLRLPGNTVLSHYWICRSEPFYQGSERRFVRQYLVKWLGKLEDL